MGFVRYLPVPVIPLSSEGSTYHHGYAYPESPGVKMFKAFPRWSDLGIDDGGPPGYCTRPWVFTP